MKHQKQSGGSGVRRLRAIGVGFAAVALTACADGDNPTALADLVADVEFEFDAVEIETFEEVTIEVLATESGERMEIREARLEVTAPSGLSREVHLEEDEHGYGVSTMFFEAGEHRVHLRGMPRGHSLDAEVGEMEVDVVRRHQAIGPYWVELQVEPAPVFVGTTAHIEFFVFDLLPSGERGAAAGGLDVALEVNDPDGIETVATIDEENPGEYEAEFGFTKVGEYEFHFEIEVGANEFDGEFHFPVFDPEDTEGDSGDAGDGHGEGGNGDGGH